MLGGIIVDSNALSNLSAKLAAYFESISDSPICKFFLMNQIKLDQASKIYL